MSVGYSGPSRFLPSSRQPWAAFVDEACRSSFSYGLTEEWIHSWKAQVTGERRGGRRWGVSIRKAVLGAQGRWRLCQRKAHGRELLDWEKLQSRDAFPHTLVKTVSFLKNGIHAWFEPNLCSSFLSSFPLCLTLCRAKHAPKACSGSSLIPCVAAQEPAPCNAVFLDEQELFPTGLWDTFEGLRGAPALSSITAAQFEFWAAISSYLNTASPTSCINTSA